jgi:hypothetical protein
MEGFIEGIMAVVSLRGTNGLAVSDVAISSNL